MLLRRLIATLGAKVVAVFAPFVFLGIAYVFVLAYRVIEDRQNHLIVMNHTAGELAVTVGGETKTARPHEYAVFFGVAFGESSVKATGFEPKVISFSDRPSFTKGNRGIVAFGGPVNIALMKRTAVSTDAPALDSVEVLAPTDGLLLLPLHATEFRPNQHFYPAREINDSTFDCRVRACSYDPASRELGCGICRGTWKTCGAENASDLERLSLPR